MMKNTDSNSTIGPLNQTKKCDFCVAEQQNKQRLETTVCMCDPPDFCHRVTSPVGKKSRVLCPLGCPSAFEAVRTLTGCIHPRDTTPASLGSDELNKLNTTYKKKKGSPSRLCVSPLINLHERARTQRAALSRLSGEIGHKLFVASGAQK